MTAADAKTMLSREARRAWPKAAKASDLPFPDYWAAAVEWLTFHAPRVGYSLLERYATIIVDVAVAAERAGTTPEPWIVPDEVKAIWQKVETGTGPGAARPSGLESEKKIDSKRTTASARGQENKRVSMRQGRLL